MKPQAIRVRGDAVEDSDSITTLNKYFGLHGIDYYPVQGYSPYTHVVSVRSPSTQRYARDFLVESRKLLPFDGIKAPLRLRGGLSWNERFEAYSHATVVVVPSRAEPFGLVILEAMECGVPVLYPSNAGVAELIGPNECCIDPATLRPAWS